MAADGRGSSFEKLGEVFWCFAHGFGLSATSGTQQLLPFLRDQGFSGDLNGLDLLSPEGVIPWGGLFCPIHPLAAGPCGDSLLVIRLFPSSVRFTLSTPAALAHLQDLVSEPVQPWDALICSSTAGRSVVETVLRSREEALAARSGGDVSRLQASGLNFR